MKKNEIRLNDWNRILFGEGPPAYLLEVVLRVGIIYLLILIAMRFMGKRMTGEVSRAELVARVSVAAAVGLTIQRAGRGLLAAIIIVMVIVLVGRLFTWLAFKNTRFEKALYGKYAALVRNGAMNVREMMRIRVSREQVFAALRAEGIRHLGQIQRMYMEANGEFSFVCLKEEQPGLSVIPEWDKEYRARQQITNIQLCYTCGSPWNAGATECEICNGINKEPAILVEQQQE